MAYYYQVRVDIHEVVGAPNNWLVLKPLEFINPVSRGDQIAIRGYQLGRVERVIHEPGSKFSIANVVDKKGDVYIIFANERNRKIFESELADYIDRYSG